MKKILVISWYYPPINSSEGLVTFKLINNSKYQYDVFTQKENTSWSYGNNNELANNSNVKSIYSKSNTINDWAEEAYKYFVENKDKYDIVMTRAMPQESHVVGFRIKQNFPYIKWIASFGDPIKDNPYNHLSCSFYSKNSTKNKINANMSLRRKLSLKRIAYDFLWNIKHRKEVIFRKNLDKIEENTLKFADAIILNNKSQIKYMMGNNDKLLKKSYLIRHSFDESMYPNKRKANPDGKIHFNFTGHLDYIRSPYFLLKAIELLNKEVEDLSSKAEFTFYGDITPSDKLFIMDSDLLDVIKIKKSINYLESLEIMKNSDWLFHIDANISNVNDYNIFFAAKVADYFGSGTNVIGITMQEGDIIDALRESNSLVLSFSAEEIKNYLYLIIENKYSIKRNEEYISKYNSKYVAKEFDKIVDNLMR